MSRNVFIVILLGIFFMTPNDMSAQFLKKMAEKAKTAINKAFNEPKNREKEENLSTVKQKFDIKEDQSTLITNKKFDTNEITDRGFDTPEEIFIPLKPWPQQPGEVGKWQLVYKNDWEHYEKDDIAIRLWKDPSSGDFVSLLEDENGNYNAKVDKQSHIFGTYRLTLENGDLIEGRTFNLTDSCNFRYHFSNGNIIFSNERCQLSFAHDFFDKHLLLYYGGENKFLSLEGYNFILHENQTKYYPIVTYFYKDIIGDSYADRSFDNTFDKDGKKYKISKTGWPIAFMQKVNDNYYFANDIDSIISVQNNVIKYANGDEITIAKTNYGAGVLGTIHRNGGIVTAKKINGKTRCRLTMPNGDFFTGDFEESNVHGIRCDFFPYTALQYRSLTPYNGTWNRGGKIEEYVEGRNKTEVEREQAVKAAKKVAEVKAIYEKVCKEFGKKYVDAALAGNVIIGMPEKLLTNSFKTKKIRTSGVSTLYQVYGFGMIKGFDNSLNISDRVIQKSVWVSQGRVTDIINY